MSADKLAVLKHKLQI